MYLYIPKPKLCIYQAHFEWTLEMGKWFNEKTRKYSYKSIAFAALALQAESRWGYRAPDQEHLQNKIKSRDNARKNNKTVKWVLDTQQHDLGSR